MTDDDREEPEERTDPSASGLQPDDRRPTDPSASSVRRALGQPLTKSEPQSKTDPHLGKVLGKKYRVDKLIARGGMGRVYAGIQFPLERPVAIKILSSELHRRDTQFTKRFFLEAAIAAKLQHQHTITVFDYGEGESGELYIAMELLEGRPLSKVVAKEGPLAAARTFEIGIQICRALKEAHALGIIHRDLKPANVFLIEGRDDGPFIKVLDFGLVKLFAPEGEKGRSLIDLSEKGADLSQAGMLIGSPKYMSPEQIEGRDLDPRTDIYSLGVLLFQLVAGRAPYTGESELDVIYAHVHNPIPSIESANPTADCPIELETIIRRCMAKDRQQRYASMDDLLSALRTAEKASHLPPVVPTPLALPRIESVTAGVVPVVVKVEEPQKSGAAPGWLRLTVVLAAIGFLVALGTLYWVTQQPPASPATTEPDGVPRPSDDPKPDAAPAGDDDVAPPYRDNPY